MKHEPALCRDGIAESVAHHHRMLAVDRATELDTVIARLSQLHPASALKYFLTSHVFHFYLTLTLWYGAGMTGRVCDLPVPTSAPS